MLNRLLKGDTIFFLALFVVLTGLFFTLPPLGLHSNEEGVNFIQMKNFVLNGSLSIPYPAGKIGFGVNDLVGKFGFLKSKGGDLRATTPPLFPFLTSLFHPLFGDRVVHLLPLLFLYLTTILLGRTLGLVMKKGFPYYLLLVAFLGSPAFLYIFGFSAVTAALFLEAVALYLLVRYYKVKPSLVCLFGSSFAIGATLFFEPGWILMVTVWTVSGVLILSLKGKAREAFFFAVGAVAIVALWVVLEVILYGTFPGPYLQLLASLFVLSPRRGLVFFVALVLSALLLFLPGRKSLPSSLKWGSWIAVIFLFACAVLLTSAKMIFVPFILLFPAFLSLFYVLPGQIEEVGQGKSPLGFLLTAAAVLFLILRLTMQVNTPFLIPAIFPAVIPLAVVLMGLDQKRIFASKVMVGLLVLAIAVSITGGYKMARDNFVKYTDYNAGRVAFLEETTEYGGVVVFDATPFMEHAGPLFFDRIYLVVHQEGDFERIVKTLKGCGIDHLYLWTVNPPCADRFGNPYNAGSVWTFAMPRSSACGSTSIMFH